MLPIKNLFGFRKNKELDKSIIQKNPYKNNTDLEKRKFIKKGLLGLAGLGGLALASKVAKAGGLVFNDGSNQTVGGIADPGSSTDNALLRWEGTTGNAVQDATITVSDNGEMVNTSQPCVNAASSEGANTVNQTGDGTVWTMALESERFDQNADHTTTVTTTFTAPVTGKYLICGAVTPGQVSGYTRYFVDVVTSNRTYGVVQFNPTGMNVSSEQDRIFMSFAQVCDMDASDTATIRLLVDGGAKTVDLHSNGVINYVLIC